MIDNVSNLKLQGFGRAVQEGLLGGLMGGPGASPLKCLLCLIRDH